MQTILGGWFVAWLPQNRHEAQEFCARWLALIITTAVLLFFCYIIADNVTLGSGDVGVTQRVFSLILEKGPLIGGLICSIPTIISSGIALTYRNAKVDFTFYVAMLVIVFSLITLFFIEIQLLYSSPSMDISRYYFEIIDPTAVEEAVRKSHPKDVGGDRYQYLLVEAFRSRAVTTIGGVIVWYVIMLTGLLGFKLTANRQQN